MPEIRDYYVHVKDMDISSLHSRRAELIATAPSGQYRDLDDEALAELLAIARQMRKLAAVGIRKTTGVRKPKADKESLDALI